MTRAARLAALGGLLLPWLLAGCGEPEPPPAVAYRPVAFAQLAGWAEDDPRAALAAFGRSCARLATRDPGAAMAEDPALGQAAAWQAACAAAVDQPAPGDAAAARAFFEAWFQPFQILAAGEPEGLFTGYYEPLLHGSRHKNGRFTVPLHAVPADLVQIDLGAFDPELAGRTLYGRLAERQVVPYHAREAIDHGALDGQAAPLVWVDDPIAKFFLQIQGSGQVRLDDGSTVRVGYASQNGRPYRAIGRDLIEQGALTPEEVSLQSIRAWLLAHPDQAEAMMARNPSYIFFQENRALGAADGPLGAQGVPLTTGRSLAVDSRYVPLGAPVWLDTTAPLPDGAQPLRRLLIAQDRGGAIKGPVRGDVFWGAGALAEEIAGRMKSPGRAYILVPKAAVPVG
jgi:membrane-bound lytic murein transglycosylase A